MFLNYRIYTTILLICGLAFGARAQTPVIHDISGFVCTRGTSARVAAVKVLDKRTQATALTDDIGVFKIKAAIGDTLEFSTFSYTTVRSVVADLTDEVIYMNKVIQLQEVDIKGQTKQQELNSVMSDYNKKGVYYNGKPPALSAIMSPINGLYSLFGRDPKNARHFAEYSKNELEASQDHKKYNKELVKKVTNIADDELDKFTDAFKPSHEDLMKWNDYDVITYIKKSYETYKKFGAADLPKLTGGN